MKSTAVLIAVLIVVAGLGLYVYYTNETHKDTPTGSHVYLGAVYSGPAKYTNYVSASVDFKDGSNLKNDVYYVVLSIWDSNNSYDQLGITSYMGKFYSTYSYTQTLNGTIKYIFQPRWNLISPGDHNMSMYVDKGNILFKFDSNTFTAQTGGDNFTMETNQKIGNHSFAGFTIYEEIYGFNKTLPGISYNFSNVQYGTSSYPSGYVMDWMPFSHNITSVPSTVVYMKYASVNIYNTPPVTLRISVQNLLSPAVLKISDLNETIPGNGQYSFNLLPGNYTLYLVYQGVSKSYNVSLNSSRDYTVTG